MQRSRGRAVLALVADDRRKRDLVVQRLNQMPGVRCALPEGTIYAFPDSGTGLPLAGARRADPREAHVVVEAGSFYGARRRGPPAGLLRFGIDWSASRKA